MSADVTFDFAPGRGGFVMAAFVASLLIALFATVFYANRGVVPDDTRLDGSVALLLLVPALISYVAVRPTDPPLVRRYLLGLQLLVVIAAAIPVVMAVILMIDASTPNALRTAWCPCVAGAWLITGMLALSLRRSGST